MKFKLVEDLDSTLENKSDIGVLNEELGIRFYLGQDGYKIGGLFTATGKLLKQLWDEDDEHYDQINYHLSQLEYMFDVPDLDYKNNKYNFAFKKSFITDEVREIIDDLNFYLNEIDYEIIEETVDIPNIEYQDDNQFAYKSLDEEVLKEATLYRLDLYKKDPNNPKNNLKDYKYIIGNDNHNFNTIDDVKNFLSQQEHNNENINDDYLDILNKFTDIKVSKIDLLNSNEYKRYIKLLNKKDGKFLNYTHSSLRGKFQTGAGYMVHHLDGVEKNEDPYNLMGIEMDGNGTEKRVHDTIHLTNFSKHYKKGVELFNIRLWDGTAYIDKKLKITTEVL